MATKIFIDPGHGGTDPGAVGRWNLYGEGDSDISEKTVNLDFSQTLKSQLESQLVGVTCYLSRNSDINVDIGDRANDAYDKNVDALISIHFNSVGDGTVSGTETYYAKTRPNDKGFADTLQDELVNGWAHKNRGVKDDTQAAVGSLGILRNNNSGTYPRALIEVEFISNKTRMDNIGGDYAERMMDFCNCVVKAVRSYFNLSWA